MNVVVTANINDTGVININGRETEEIKIKIAPSPAPADIPRSPGSARLFFNIDCKTIPEQERDDPTSIEFNTLGNLMS